MPDEGRTGGEKYTSKLCYGELLTYDVVVTTYGVAIRQYDEMILGLEEFDEYKLSLKNPPHLKRPRRRHWPLYSMDWSCIVLDEAHCISNHDTKTHQAMCALDGNYRVAMTGTPLQNDYMP